MSTVAEIKEAIDQLSPQERAELVENLWDIAEEDAALPVPAEKRDELRRRKENFEKHPDSGRTWEEVKNHARAK